MPVKKGGGKKKPKGGKKKKSRARGASTTGRVVGVKADQSNWRVKLRQSQIKFDDVQKEVFLASFAERGMKCRSAEKAGVSDTTVRNHLKNDPDFADQYDRALQIYRDKVNDAVYEGGVIGRLEPIYQGGARVMEVMYGEDGLPLMFKGEDGVERPVLAPASVRKHSDHLIILEAKRVDPSYRDKQTIDLDQRGGVLVAPHGVTPEEWIREQETKNVERDRLHAEREAEKDQRRKDG